MVCRLRVNHRKNPSGIPWDKIKFSFWADKGSRFNVTIMEIGTGDCTWQGNILLEDASGFYPEVIWKLGTEYQWIVTDEAGECSNGYFSTAQMLDADFISPVQDMDHPDIRKTFELRGEEVRQVQLIITGLGLYRAFINGVRVGDTYLTPYYNDYDNYLRYQTYDITQMVRSGDNEISVLLGNGWALGRFGLEGKDHIYAERPVLCAKILIEYQDGYCEEIRTDETWTAIPSVIVSDGIYDGEIRDDTLQRQNSGLQDTCKKVDVPYPLVPDFSLPVVVKAKRKPKLYISPKGEQILDFEQEVTGVVSFCCRESEGTRITLKHGELLQDGCFYNENLRTAKAEFVYISDGVEKQVEPMFSFMGFRYVLVEGVDQVDPQDYTAFVLYSDMEDTLGFYTDHQDLNQLVENTRWGQRGNFLDVPTDCPQRDERLGWSGDTQVFSGTACYNMDCFLFYRKNMRDLRYEQTNYYDGELPMFSPSLKKAMGAGGAVWSDVGVIVPWNMYMAYGDKRQLEENYPMMRDYAQTLVQADESQGGEHLLREGFTYGDWLALDGITEQSRLGGTDETFIRTVYYRNTMQLTALAAGELGFSDEKKKFEKCGEAIRTALQREFFTATGRFALNTQTAYILALHYDVTPDREQTKRQLYDCLKKSFFHLKTGFTGTPLLIHTLFENGMDEEAYRILFYEEYPGWMYAIHMGATTIWERWNSVMPDGTCSGTGMNSLNHYANGSVCEAVYQYAAGLKNVAPGWRKVIVEPHPCSYLREAKIGYDSVSGHYEVEWKTSEKEFEMTVTIPHGTQALIRLPGLKEKKEEQADAGVWKYHYETDWNLTEKFSEDPLVLDAMQDPRGREIICRREPELYESLTGMDKEFQVLRFHELETVNKMLGKNCDLPGMLGELRGIR